MQALVLVGGLGTRLRPLTYHVPKAMVPIANVPFVERFMDYLEANGVEHVVFAMGYLPDLIRDYLSKRSGKAKFDFIVEEHLLGTAGAIKNAEPLLGERFFVINGDMLMMIPLRELYRVHEQKGGIATLVLMPVDDPSRYGVVVTDDDGRVRAFIEKPPREAAPSHLVNAGVYLYEREVLSHIPAGQPYSVERGLYPKLLERGAPLYAVAFPDVYWLDIGKLEHYLQSNFDVLTQKVPLPVPGEPVRPGVWVGKSVRIAETAQLQPPVLIGDECVIEEEAVVGPCAVLGSGVTVGRRAAVREAVLWEACRIGAGAVVERCALGSRCEVAQDAVVEPDRAYGCDEHIR